MVKQRTITVAVLAATSGLGLLGSVETARGAEAAASASATPTPVPASSVDEASSADPAAAAAPPPQVTEPEPTAHHAPRSTAIQRRDLTLSLSLDFAERVKAVWLVYSVGGSRSPKSVAFARGGEEGFRAVIPAADVTSAGLAYSIELERTDGRRVAVFASRAEPHAVSVHDDPRDLGDLREQVELARLGGRRSEVGMSADYVSFGRSNATNYAFGGSSETTSVRDGYYRLEGRYTYRLLRQVSEFSLRLGVVRGTAPVEVAEAKQTDDPYAVGLNYGATTVRFRVRDGVAFEPGLLLSVNQVAFSLGYSGTLLLGDTRGAHVRVGFETIQIFGSRYFGRLEVAITEQVRLAPSVELTNMPSANDYGVRLLGELSVDLGSGLAVAARGGYQAREAASGGPAAGGELRWAF